MSSPDLSSKDYLLKSYTYWDLALHENQCYLGRVYVMLKSCEGVEDFLSIKGDVRDELFMIGEKIKDVLKILFSPDKFNIASLSKAALLFTYILFLAMRHQELLKASNLKTIDGDKTMPHMIKAFRCRLKYF